MLKHQLDKHRITWEGETRQRIETFLADHAAKRQYDWEARKRLYEAVGPLRFQLLLACRDLASRIERHDKRQSYEMSLDRYYARSFLYRCLRPLVICELVERQMSVADFSVDSDGRTLLQFSRAAKSILAGKSVIKDRGDANWEEQTQHIFHDVLSKIADSLIVREDGRERCMRFTEFEELLKSSSGKEALHPLPDILGNFSARTKPLFWLRLVAYGNVCNHLVGSLGHDLGFERRNFPVEELLAAADDALVSTDIKGYAAQCRSFANHRL
ncbi:hypothetical protein [Burkholderia sp. Ac-20379]|uniref:hypothetical protein n=1 Tax=Burkholderia sp. Ac-20379 TaxID=2703900 RepID=UPI00197F2307|nr:hypothetical protein [Burkholderia sp. Ac-20379]MBN3723553.1 hypothetical protein [Burkholderia sp. Ac-20379]